MRPETGGDPYNNNVPEERELSIEGINLILEGDMLEFKKDQIKNPEHPGPKKKGEKVSDDEGSPWRLAS